MAEIISMPKLGFDMAEGTLVRWMKKAGEAVNKGEVLAEIETDKATVEVESSATGVVRSLVVEEGAVVPVGSPIAIVGTSDEVIQESSYKGLGEQETSKVAQTGNKKPGGGSLKLESRPSAIGNASPLARKIAVERQLDLANIKGSGPAGRIVRRDVEEALAAGNQQAALSKPQAFGALGHGDETVSMPRLRQAIGRRMADSKKSIPHFYVTHEYKMDALMDLRVQFNKIVPESEKLSVNDFIVKAVALVLRLFPNLNASLNGNSVLHHGQVNVGVAVSVEGGLLTVVCRDAEQKPLRQVAAEVTAMAARAREGKVKPEDIEGSTFSISNLGMYEVENFIAIINPPEAAILAVGSAHQVPVVEGGTIKTGWRMKATLSVDHRISDGVEAARFMQALAEFLEEPLRLVV
jgi:pyruvate dehydrogenase E2 component (dihydrolipoamide acetyltransferase)